MTRTSLRDPTLSARVVSRRPLRYGSDEAAGEDRGAHVRAGSSIAWLGARLCVIQDDASFLAVLDGPSGDVRHVALDAIGGRRRFDEARGNKHLKLDLEACVTVHVGGVLRLFAFGSGSTPARERVIVVRDGEAPRTVHARALYAMLHARDDFSGSELNLEGAVFLPSTPRPLEPPTPPTVLFLQRGNGAPKGSLAPIDACATVDALALSAYLDDPDRSPVPALGDVAQWDLGRADGHRLTFTDGVRMGSGVVLYVAAAEASPDATRDGPVAGVALGVLGGRARWTLVQDESGLPLLDKVEGLAVVPGSDRNLLAVVDKDDPDVPSELLTIELAGDWT